MKKLLVLVLALVFVMGCPLANIQQNPTIEQSPDLSAPPLPNDLSQITSSPAEEQSGSDLTAAIQIDPRVRRLLGDEKVVDRTAWAREQSEKYRLANPDAQESGFIKKRAEQFRQRMIQQQQLEQVKPSATQDSSLPIAGSSNGSIFGGVGFGIYYNWNFLYYWKTFTSIAMHAIAPRNFGGNNPGEIANTQTNGSSHGVEVVLDYVGQNDVILVVFDWSIYFENNLTNPNNIVHALTIPFSGLSDYLANLPCDNGTWRQQIWFYNYTIQVNSSTNQWRNLVQIRNFRTNTWDTLYNRQYTWDKITEDNLNGLNGGNMPLYGTWGPILEEVSNQSPSGQFRLQGCHDAEVYQDIDDDGYFPINTYISNIMKNMMTNASDPLGNPLYVCHNYAYACGSTTGEPTESNSLDIQYLMHSKGTSTGIDGLRINKTTSPGWVVYNTDSRYYPDGWGQITQGNKYVLQLYMKTDMNSPNNRVIFFGLRNSTYGYITYRTVFCNQFSQANTYQPMRLEFTAPSTTMVYPVIYYYGNTANVNITTMSLVLE